METSISEMILNLVVLWVCLGIIAGGFGYMLKGPQGFKQGFEYCCVRPTVGLVKLILKGVAVIFASLSGNKVVPKKKKK